VVLYPLTIPVIIAGVRGTSAVVAEPADLAMAQFWIALLASFDAVFILLALWTFEPLMTE
jgi:ABC-type transport system involved in cytochrome c biogenesis permease component